MAKEKIFRERVYPLLGVDTVLQWKNLLRDRPSRLNSEVELTCSLSSNFHPLLSSLARSFFQ